MFRDELKRKLRQYKKLEMSIRFGQAPPRPGARLVWSEFFSDKDEPDPHARYAFKQLLDMSPDQLKSAFAEYFFAVYYQYYRENALALDNMYDPRLLSLLGLPPTASQEDIRKRFRELARRYHPDHGGDSRQFIELVDIYEHLTEQ
jgi:hypothetical protein